MSELTNGNGYVNTPPSDKTMSVGDVFEFEHDYNNKPQYNENTFLNANDNLFCEPLCSV